MAFFNSSSACPFKSKMWLSVNNALGLLVVAPAVPKDNMFHGNAKIYLMVIGPGDQGSHAICQQVEFRTPGNDHRRVAHPGIAHNSPAAFVTDPVDGVPVCDHHVTPGLTVAC